MKHIFVISILLVLGVNTSACGSDAKNLADDVSTFASEQFDESRQAAEGLWEDVNSLSVKMTTQAVVSDASNSVRSLADESWQHVNSPEVQATAQAYVQAQVDQVKESTEETWTYVNSPEVKATAQSALHTAQEFAVEIKLEHIDPVLSYIVADAVRIIASEVIVDAESNNLNLTEQEINGYAQLAANQAAAHAAQMTTCQLLASVREIEIDLLASLATRAASKAGEEAAYEVTWTLASSRSKKAKLPKLISEAASIAAKEFSNEFTRQIVVEAILSSMQEKTRENYCS